MIFQLGLLLISLVQSEVLLHRFDYEISNHPSRNNEVGTLNNLPSNNCEYNNLNDSILELFKSPEVACINLERNFWKNVEAFCPKVNENYDAFSKNHFQYPVNLRVLAYNLEMIYLSFDIIGDSPKLYGNWWRIYLVDKSYHIHNNGIGFDYDDQDKMIELTGRVVDHWNGTYSVLFGIPVVNLGNKIANKKITFTLDMTLDYLACAGYAEPLFPWKKLHGKVSYIGDLAMRLKLDIYVNVTASSPCTMSNMSDTRLSIAQYLCDTGHYNSNIWIPSKSTHHCSEGKPHSELLTDSYITNTQPTPMLKSSVDFDKSKKNKLILFIGDSTTSQAGRCYFFQMDSCGNSQQCNRAKYSIQLCKKLALSSRYKDAWNLSGTNRSVITFMSAEDNFSSSKFTRYLKRTAEEMNVNKFNEFVIVFNIGLHEMQNAGWSAQKSHIRALITTFTSDEMKKSFQVPLRVVWRSTWSIHEYCYQRNNYWFRENSILSTYTVASGVTRLRDPTSWLHHSYVLDSLYNISTSVYLKYADNYWLSKSRVKRYSAENRQHDMRHHDTIVISASVETTLDSVF